MFKLVNLVLVVVIFACVLAIVSATNSTSLSDSTDEEARRRRRRYPLAWKAVWWWGLKALSVFVTVKIKIILLLLFLGGGVFYGLKIWQGTALGCPEPIIQEIKHHDHDFSGISPFHGHDDFPSYPGPPESFGGGLGGLGGYLGGLIGGGDPTPYSNSGSSSFANAGPDYSSVYSQTPASPVYSGPNYLPPSGSSSSQGLSYPPSASAGLSQDPTQQYPTNKRRRVSGSTGRQISEETQTLFGDLMFRFLGVNTDQCKRRFVCELEFRNPFMGYAFKYIGVELFKEFITPKDGVDSPKKFTDCARLYSECKAPNEQPIGIKKKKQFRRKYQTVTPSPSDETTVESDLVTQYVQQQRQT